MPISMYIVNDYRLMFMQTFSLLEALTFLSRCIIIQLILLCAGLSFINQAFSGYIPFTPTPITPTDIKFPLRRQKLNLFSHDTDTHYTDIPSNYLSTQIWKFPSNLFANLLPLHRHPLHRRV